MRLIHDRKNVIMVVESDAVKIATPHTIYTGTEDGCRAEIKRLGLIEKDGFDGVSDTDNTTVS